MSSKTLRLLAYAAVVGGMCWIATAVLSVTLGSNDDVRLVLEGAADYALFAAFAAALALTIPGLLALHAHQRGADGRLGAVATIIAATGAGAQCAVICTILIEGGDGPWFDTAAPLAILTWVVGSVALGVAVQRAGLMPAWVGIGLPIATVLAIVGAAYGTSVVTGVFLIAVGFRMVRASATAGVPFTGAPRGAAPSAAQARG